MTYYLYIPSYMYLNNITKTDTEKIARFNSKYYLMSFTVTFPVQ